MVKYNQIKVDAPLADAFRSVGHPVRDGDLGRRAVGLTTVMMILLLGQTRVFFAMSRDRLLPPVFSKVSPRFGHPSHHDPDRRRRRAHLDVHPLTELAELVNIGTLFAFVLVAIGVIVLRRTRPDLQRAFRCPGCRWSRPRRAGRRLADAQPAGRDLAPVRHLDGDRPRRLLRLRRSTAASSPTRTTPARPTAKTDKT